MRSRPLLAVIAVALASGCGGKADDAPKPPASAAPSAPSALAATASATAPSAPAPRALERRDGSAIALDASGRALLVVDEDHHALRVVPLPLDPATVGPSVRLTGAPAQVVATARGALVTVRDPGLLVTLEENDKGALVERARVELPVDAWGLALAKDGATAYVTSAWSHALTAVDLARAKVKWTISTAREPRGVVLTADGKSAYVTHLVGAALTRVDDLDAATPSARSVVLPPSPLRTPAGRTLDAALGYAAALSPGGDRLFVARHALGALGKDAWFGAATVDVLMIDADAPLAPRHVPRAPFLRADNGPNGDELKVPGGSLTTFTQPRAIAVRRSTGTLLVAGEGDDRVVELDAESVDPTLSVVRTMKTGDGYDAAIPVATSGGAPQGIALSADESTAYVLCRATYDVVELALDPATPEDKAATRRVRFADDDLDATGAAGRRLFYNGTDKLTSGGVACAGCHPEGRDDGHVWHEAKINTAQGVAVNFLGEADDAPEEDHVKGAPRRTPILAGRVSAQGPYGWHAESPTLEARLESGFGLHRWATLPAHEAQNLAARAARLASFLRKGLTPPPRVTRPATPEEERGKAVFTSEATQCTRCHVPATEFTDRTAYPMKLAKLGDFDDEERVDFKVPSLLYVGGHGRLLHDGSAASLEELID
ncbi:MAG TPA: hypothetical protein VGM56_18350, partial [Byssovorax sp.]